LACVVGARNDDAGADTFRGLRSGVRADVRWIAALIAPPFHALFRIRLAAPREAAAASAPRAGRRPRAVRALRAARAMDRCRVHDGSPPPTTTCRCTR